MKDRNYVGLVDFYDDEPEPIYCPFCLKFDSRVKLGPRLTPKGEEPLPESERENWLQCPQCGEIIPIYEAEPEAEIEENIETIQNPFESNKFIIESIPKRTSPAGKKAAAKKRRKKLEHKDKDIQQEIDRVGEDRVKVLFESNP